MSLSGKIAYLEITDFNNKGEIINKEIPKDKKVIVMVQASWCGACSEFKPIYQKFADNHSDEIFCATIQIDGDRESEKQLGKNLDKIKKIKFIPEMLLFSDGSCKKLLDKKLSSKTEKSLEKFALQ